jgi:predicted DsbA family dithiol-disulfide isomerase
MHMDIVSDTICPWCYIGKRRLERALAEAPRPDLTVMWRPFQLNPDMPADGMDRQDYLVIKFGGAEHAQQVYEPVVVAGRSENIPFDFGAMRRSPNTIQSHRLIRYAGEAGRQDAVIESLFKGYFTEGKDIGDIAVLADLAAASGMEREEVLDHLDGPEGREAVQREDAMARETGIRGVPAFILERKYLISGAQGPEAFHRAFEMASEAAADASVAE